MSKKSQRVHAQPLSSPSVCYTSQPSYKLSTSSGCHLERRWVWKDRVGNTQNARAHHRSQQHMRHRKIVLGRRGGTKISNIWPGPSTAGTRAALAIAGFRSQRISLLVLLRREGHVYLVCFEEKCSEMVTRAWANVVSTGTFGPRNLPTASSTPKP